jgi:hypothetical protein
MPVSSNNVPVAAKNWYVMLGVTATAAVSEIVDAVELKSRQAAAMANTAPERSQQLREDIRAIKRDLLSGEVARRAYDASLQTQQTNAVPVPPAVPAQHVPNVPTPATAGRGAVSEGRRRGNRFLQFLQTGWTCPACGEGALPSDKFCPRCGATIATPGGAPPTAAVIGDRTACARCGVTLTADTRFCTGCGTSVS